MLFKKIIPPVNGYEIKPIKRGRNKLKYIIGGDSETCNGEPITFQFFHPQEKLCAFIETSPRKSFSDFVGYLDSLPNNGGTYVIYIHNLKFDLVSFFYDRLHLLKNEEIDFQYKNWTFKGVYANTTFLYCFHANKHKTVCLIDTSAFLYGSLDSLSKIICPDLPKLKAPKGLGKKKFRQSDLKFFQYAMRDAEICHKVGLFLEDLHEDYDIQQTVSIASMAAKIFRRKYLKVFIPEIPKNIMFAALHSYHGGKNNITVPRGVYKNVYGLDIISAYPYAMSMLPSFSKKNLYKKFRGNSRTKRVPEFGVYKVSGNAKACKWPVLFNHGFKAITGDFENIWTTGFELNEGLRIGEIKLSEIFGYYYEAKMDKIKSPFKEYVAEFFRLKDIEKDPIKRMAYKILLNSLYGKFIATNKKYNNDDTAIECNLSEKIKPLKINADKHASGLFHPFIATLITGHTRAYIHKLEHKYKALHTSTDGIITKIKPQVKKGLGGLKLEFEGNAEILRNKLYIIRNKKGEIIKYALHGFHGDINTLLKCLKNPKMEYRYMHVNKVKESLNRGLKANNFEQRIATLKLGEK